MRRHVATPRKIVTTQARPIRVLYVGGGSTPQDPVASKLLANGRFVLARPGSVEEFDDLLDHDQFDVVVSELRPFGRPELAILDQVAACQRPLPVVILTSEGSEAWAVEAMKRGAADYFSRRADDLDRLPDRLHAVTLHAAGPPAANGRSGQGVARRRAHPPHVNGTSAEAPASHDAALPAPGGRDELVYSRILNALAVNVALLDEHGRIRAVNDAWRRLSFDNFYQNAALAEGVDYLEVCDRGISEGVDGAAEIAAGLRRVLDGQCASLSVEYSAGAPPNPRWYKIVATPVRSDERHGAIVVHVDITDRRRAEQERERLFEQSLNLLCIVGLDGYMKRWNPAWCGVLGYSYDEMLSLPLRDLLHPGDVATARAAVEQLLSGQDTSAVEVRVRCKDGSFRWILWQAVPCLEQGVFFATGQDITGRKQAEEQLRQSQERFQLIASATKEAVWDWDLRANRWWRNESYERHFGQPDLDHIIEWWRERIHPDDRERIMAAMPPPVREGQQKWMLEYRMRRTDGSYAHVYDRGFSIFDAQGDPVRMVGSIMDISDLKNTEERLRQSEERFRLASNATRDAIWDWDIQHGTVWRSEGFQALFGYQADEITPDVQWWADRIHPDDRHRVLSQLADPGRYSAQHSTFEYRFRRSDGSYADVLERGYTMLQPDGRPLRMVGSVMDISERRRAEQAAHLHRAELAHIARVSTMGEIATGLAHELNQPLAAIANYAESCMQAMRAQGARSDERLLTWLERIAANTHRAGEMIRRLRGFTRKSEPRRSTVSVQELVSEVIELLETETRLQGIRVCRSVDPALLATVDRIQVQQVLVNLIRNAFEAMASTSTEQRQVTITAAARDNRIEVMVEDLGEGIATELLERVFEAFYTSKPNGVGIGLAISRSIIEDHGGRMWVQPNPHQGVTFHFTLPMSGA